MVTLKSNQYKLGNFLPQWKAEDAQTITFIVTEDCNLRCKYCYITHKSSNKKRIISELGDINIFDDIRTI